MRLSFGSLIVALAILAVLATRTLTAQDAATLQRSDPPPNGVWIDSLDLSKAPLRRPRTGRAQPTPPPLTFALGGISYPHAVPLQSDGDLTIQLGGAAVKFMAMVGIDDSVQGRAGQRDLRRVGRWKESDGLRRHARRRRAEGAVDRSHGRTASRSRDDRRERRHAGDNADWAGAVDHHDARWPGASSRAAGRRIGTGDRLQPYSLSRMINYPRITGATPGRPFLFRIPGVGRGAAHLQRQEPSRRPRARSGNRHHHRLARRSRGARSSTVTVKNAKGTDASGDHDRRRQGRARADAAARLELVERLGRHGRRPSKCAPPPTAWFRAASRRRATPTSTSTTRGKRLAQGAERRNDVAAGATRTARSSRTRSSPT